MTVASASLGMPYLGYFVPSGGELVVLLVIGLLLYGRRLPEVGRVVGRTVHQLRRQFDDFKRELSADESFRDARSHLRDLQSTVRDAQSSVRDVGRSVDVRRQLPDPSRLFDDLTDTTRSTRAEPPKGESEADRASEPRSNGSS